MHSFLSYFSSSIFPHKCLLCNTIVDRPGFCPGCWSTLNFITGPGCKRCAAPLKLPASSCFFCEASKLAISESRALLAYDDASRPLVMGIKYGGRTHLAYALGGLMNKLMKDFIGDYQVLCPVPLHRKRLVRRLYNQATLMSFGVDLPTRNLLTRHKFTSTQKGLSRKEREKNVKNSFRTRITPIGLENVLLIDDLFTTGATANECARELLKAGAKKVGLLTLCRVV